MTKRTATSICVVFFSLVIFGAAREENLEGISRKFSEIRSFSADFKQVSYDSFQDRSVSSSGKLYFKKPGLMRWEYGDPEKQSVFINKRRVTLYDPYLENVTLQRIEEVDLIESLFFFRSTKPISETFTWIERPSKDLFGGVASDRPVFLSPKKRNPFVKELHLSLSEEGEIRRLAVLEENGNYRKFIFENYMPNPLLDDGFFYFEIPPGMEVIDASN